MNKELKIVLDYKPDTGIFIWKKPIGCKIKAGSIAGSISKSTGYRAIRYNGVLYLAHRLAWWFVTGNIPDDNIDHINNIRSDNRFSNLREATKYENNKNRLIRKDSKTGHKGVSYRSDIGRWQARITHNRKRISLGFYDTAEEAHAAYCSEADKLYGEFSNYG